MSQEGLLRPGIAQIRVLDMDEAIEHYVERLGLDVVSKEDDGRVYLKCYDEFGRHSVVLRETDRAGLDFFAFKAESDAAMDGFAKRVADWGLEVDEVAAGEMPGTGRRIGFTIPTGHRIEIFGEMELSDKAPETVNPHIWKGDPPRGMKAQRLDHCLLYGPNLDETNRFLIEALDFHVPEVVKLPDGKLFAIWATVSNKAHDIALVSHEEPGKLHHIAFFLQDWAEVGNAADIITQYNMPLDLGPTRHGITRGQTIYFFDPSGNRNEVFAGGYTAYKDHPQRTWDMENVGRGIFYYERKLNDAFLSVLS